MRKMKLIVVIVWDAHRIKAKVETLSSNLLIDGRRRNLFLREYTYIRNICVRDLKLENPHIKVPDLDRPVYEYVNESLTRSNRQLLAKCRDFKKANKVPFLWIRRENIY